MSRKPPFPDPPLLLSTQYICIKAACFAFEAIIPGLRLLQRQNSTVSLGLT